MFVFRTYTIIKLLEAENRQTKYVEDNVDNVFYGERTVPLLRVCNVI